MAPPRKRTANEKDHRDVPREKMDRPLDSSSNNTAELLARIAKLFGSQQTEVSDNEGEFFGKV